MTAMDIGGLIQYGALAVVSLYSTFILVRQYVRGELAERGGSGAAPVALRPRRPVVSAHRQGRVAPACARARRAAPAAPAARHRRQAAPPRRVSLAG